MRVFVVSYQALGESMWYLETVISKPENLDTEIEALFRVGAELVRVETVDLTDDQIVVAIYGRGTGQIEVIKH